MIEIPTQAKALIFDLDGTIADTMQSHFVSWRKAILPHGINFDAQLFTKLTGMPRRATIEKLNEMFGTNMNPETVGEVKSSHFETLVHLTKEIKVVTDVVKKYHGKLPMAIGTGSHKEGAFKTLHVIGLTDYFDAVVTSDDVTHFKPHPETFLKCAELMQIDPKDCVVFEDGVLGMDAAEEAGMMVIDINKYYQTVLEE